MTGHRQLVIPCLLMMQALAGCQDGQPPAADKWIGQWNGPEATFLRIEGSKGNYSITIQNLDGARTFTGQSSGSQVLFERGGVKESIRATSGRETGMKWLSDRKDCLTVRLGEGYCRD